MPEQGARIHLHEDAEKATGRNGNVPCEQIRSKSGKNHPSELDPERKKLSADVIEQVEIELKYEGYISRQHKQVEQFLKMEEKKIPDWLDYDEVPSLRLEARQKLKEFRPVSVGQASRISGVSPADISVLLVFLEHYGRRKKTED